MSNRDLVRRGYTARGYIIAYAVAIVLFLIAAFIVFFNVEGDKQVPAAIGLVGTALTVSVTLIGLSFNQLANERNHQLQEETEKRLTLEGQRNEQLQRETEERLKLEASMKAVSLLTSSDGRRAEPQTLAGAIFTLTSLGSVDFALALLWELRKEAENNVSPSAAMWVLERGLDPTCSPSVHHRAATILQSWAKQFGAAGIKELPQPLHETWDISLSRSVRIKLLAYLIDAHMYGPDVQTTRDLETLTVPLYNIMVSDEEIGVTAAKFLRPICSKLCDMRPRKIHSFGAKRILFDSNFRQQVNEKASKSTLVAVTLKARLAPFTNWLDAAEKRWSQPKQASTLDDVEPTLEPQS